MKKIFNQTNAGFIPGYVYNYWRDKSAIIEKAIRIFEETIIISSNSKFYLYGNIKRYFKHIKVYKNYTNKNIYNFNNIVEWGAGYGGQAEIIKRKNPKCTYIIIDLPIMIYIQSLYLYKFEQNIIRPGNWNIKKGCINFWSISYIEKYIEKFNFAGDIFISTWGISESNIKSINHVFKNDFYKSKNLLIAYNKNKISDYPAWYGKRKINNIKIIDIDDNNQYIMR